MAEIADQCEKGLNTTNPHPAHVTDTCNNLRSFYCGKGRGQRNMWKERWDDLLFYRSMIQLWLTCGLITEYRWPHGRTSTRKTWRVTCLIYVVDTSCDLQDDQKDVEQIDKEKWKHETLMLSGEDGCTARLNRKWVAKIQAYFTWGSVWVIFGKEQERTRTAMTDFCEYSKCTEQNELLFSFQRSWDWEYV